MLYIGGGAGMAPMRSHLYELFKTLKTGRKVTYFYGGRSRAELFYIHYFRDLEKDFPIGKVDKDNTGNEVKLDNETYIITTLIDIPEFKLYD